jgi:hypothetical protein
MVKVLLVPPVTLMLLIVKPLTASLKVNVKVTLPVAVVPSGTLSLMVTVGAVVSTEPAGADALPPPPHAVSIAATAKAAAASLGELSGLWRMVSPVGVGEYMKAVSESGFKMV